VKAVTFSPDGRLALTGSISGWRNPKSTPSCGELILWDTKLANCSVVLTTQHPLAESLSMGGTRAVTCSQLPASANISVWDVATGDVIRRFDGIGALDITFGPDDSTILVNTMTSLVRLMDIATGQDLRTYEGLDDPSFDVAISPNGKYLFAASMGTAIIWDFETGQELSRFDLPTAAIAWAVFPPDSGTAFIVQDNTTSVIEWQLSSLPSLAELMNGWLKPLSAD
jgi:WD40 repeat protein